MDKPKTPPPAKKTTPKKRKTPEDGKRPYIRTKRPKDYNPSSTVTFVDEDKLRTSSQNVYDAVLAESEDLLKAASEAQALGRLKLASSYLLLLHARIIGLGKRFDKSKRPDDLNDVASIMNNDITDPKGDPATGMSPKTAVANKLAQMLPSHIEYDQAMMEHLAKAAAELHAARTGTKRSNSTTSTDSRTFLANSKVASAATTSNTIAFSNTEMERMRTYIDAGKEIGDIATLMNRSETQVKAFVNNHKTKKKITAELLHEMGSPDRRNVLGRKMATAALTTVPNASCDIRDLLEGSKTESEK